MKLISISLNASATAQFNPSALRKAIAEAKAFKSKSILIEMDLDLFLELAAPVNFRTSTKWEDLKDIPANTVFDNIPYLRVEDARDEIGGLDVFECFGHEGRHRAKFLKQHGYRSMPVILYGAETRWYEEGYYDKTILVKPEERSGSYKRVELKPYK